ncbi:YicC family protein [bacterium]|nr:MAG: YicC family protein [bacterium]
MNSMTGFGSQETRVTSLGKINIEIRSANHKFLEVVCNLPEGFLFLEDKIKKEIETRAKRGRILCVINISGGRGPAVSINHVLLNQYLAALRRVKKQLQVTDNLSLDTLINLPGVLSITEHKVSKANIWPRLRPVLRQALDGLEKTRRKEGLSLSRYLRARAGTLERDLMFIDERFKKVVQAKSAKIETDDERSGMLKETDISEEIERLAFHIRNFIVKLKKRGAIGKELDFISQEMQREANTMAAKSCDVLISSRAVQLKSQLDKIREQLQNIE